MTFHAFQSLAIKCSNYRDKQPNLTIYASFGHGELALAMGGHTPNSGLVHVAFGPQKPTQIYFEELQHYFEKWFQVVFLLPDRLHGR